MHPPKSDMPYRKPNVPPVTTILQKVCQDETFLEKLSTAAKERQQDFQQVQKAAGNVYHEVSKHAHGTSDGFKLVRSHHAPPEFVAFLILVRFLQDSGSLNVELEVVEE
jgi:hypothetical protein